MFKQIMVPIDLGHADDMARAVEVAAGLAKVYGANLTFVGVSSPLPGDVAHTPEEFADKLSAFALAQGEKFGVTAAAHAALSHDPSSDLDETLMKATQDLRADLIVMATHVPGLVNTIWPSHGGRLASRSDVSVFLIR